MVDEVIIERKRNIGKGAMLIHRAELEPLHLLKGEQLEVIIKKVEPQEAS